MMKITSLLTLAVAAFVVTVSSAVPSVAQIRGEGERKAPVFRDEFSDLDEGNNGVSVGEFGQSTTDRLDKARQRYLLALESIEKGDTVKAARHFDESIAILNELADEPEIDKDRDYTELVQAIIEDYESYVTNIDDLSTDTPIFILRDRMFVKGISRPRRQFLNRL